MSKTVCAEAGCPTLIDTKTRSGRCPPCSRAKDKARGTRQQRGYDAAYDAERRTIEHAMANGHVFTCWGCTRTIYPHAWHLGHCDDDRDTIHGPLCPPCNLRARGACTHPSHDPTGGGEGPPSP